jgi:peptide/nickel transport system substrate-binding protein
VLAKDAVASINRWAVRESIGQLIKAAENELKPTSDRSFVWQLKRPFPKIPLALGHFFTPCFIMPARVAATDPAKPISDHTGSGPLRFVANEWVPGARALFETFAGYVPRSEPSSGMAGAKRMLVDRVEWVIIPDPATATAALQSGEVDWLEYPLPDLIPLLRKNKDVVVRLKDTVGQDGVMRLNHLHPPFNDVRARRALLMALSQEDFMRAFVGDDDSAWKRMPGFFNPGTPLYTEDGGEILKGPRNIAAAKKLLAESGYSGEPVTMLVAEDNPVLKVWGDVAADLLKQLDIKVDFVATDWGTVIARRTQKAPPAQGGWNIYLTWLSGVDCMDASNKFLRANGEQALPGWPSSPEVEREISAWYDAKTPDDEKAHIRALNRAALENVTYAPLGVYLPHYAWRKNVTGIAEGAVPLFWGVAKSA